MRSFFILTALISLSPLAQAKLDYDKVAPPISLRPGMFGSGLELGQHYRVFIVEKNIKRENQVVVFSELDNNCTFKADRNERGQPSFDFYWWMENRAYGKNPAPALRPHMKEELKVQGTGAGGTFSVLSKNIAKIAPADLGGNPNFTVKAEKKGAGCEVNAYITIKGKTIRVNSMYVHGEAAGLFNQSPAVCKIIINEGESTQVVLRGDRSDKNDVDSACSTAE